MSLNIIETDFKWAFPLYPRPYTDYIVLHHEAGQGTVEDIHRYHLSLGWSGIAYHFYVRRDGSVYRGRPLAMKGGHCSGYNDCSIGICAEGNFENETMGDAQKNALRELVFEMRQMYPEAAVVAHRDLLPTACPGRNYPFDYIAEEIDLNNPIYETLKDIETQAPWGYETALKLKDKGYLQGDGDAFNVSRDMLRILVILDRAGQFD